MQILKILGFIFLLAGGATVFASRWLVERYRLDEKTKCDFEYEMDDEELKRYKTNKAVVNLKMLGLLVALPGIVIILLVF